MIHHEGHMLRAPGSHYNDPGVEAETLVKYAERGWKLLDVAWPEERHFSINRQVRSSRRGELQGAARSEERRPHTNHPIRNSRRVGDKYSWIIPFDTTYVADSETPDYVLEYAIFTLKKGFSPTSESLDTAKVKFYVVGLAPYAAATLCYRYTFGNWHWIAFLESMLASKVHERPLLKNPGYVRPDGWTYWDDYIPDFYWAWEKSKAKKKDIGGGGVVGKERLARHWYTMLVVDTGVNAPGHAECFPGCSWANCLLGKGCWER